MHLKLIIKKSTALHLPLSMYMFMSMHVHVYMCVSICACVCITCAHVYVYVHIHVGFHVCTYVRIYKCVHVFMCMCVCAGVWRTESTLHLLFQELFTQLSERVSYWSLRLTSQPRLVGQRAQEICLSRPPKFWDLKDALLGSYAGDENQSKLVMLVCQPLHQLNHLPNHPLVFGFVYLFF